MRVLIAGLLGGIVFFMWGFVAHTVLPIGEMGMKMPTSEEPVLAAARDSLPGEGVYVIPGLAPDKMSDEEPTPAAYTTWSIRPCRLRMRRSASRTDS